ncbi:hypothetical protein [Anaeromyxobacter terrae]|uniref:hypothetical protein n=1 Tax=Anaeromyxobacter terrae TaxID=2925406 RepID=UPI001F55AFD6|nr:hypothetical protein [Anaeromyxobacter sp. SG22]
MARPGIEVSGWDVRWTGDELAESYEELGELEALVEGVAADEATGEGGEIELVATLEGRGARAEGARAPAAAPPRTEPPEDAETFAIAPELELLDALAEYGSAEAARDEGEGDGGEKAPLVIAFLG